MNWRALLLVGCVAVSACGVGRGAGAETPEEALMALQTALADEAVLRVLELQDADTRAYFRQRVQTARARAAAGEAPSGEVSDELAVALLHAGSPEEATARATIELGQLSRMTDWLTDCTIVEQTAVEERGGRTMATLRVRAADGAEHEVYFLREPQGWTLDAFRHFQTTLHRNR